MRAVCAGLFVYAAGNAAQAERGCARCLRDDLHVLPGDAARPTRAERLERSFLSGEARGEMLRGGEAMPGAVEAFARREDALDEARRAPQDFTHAANFDNVYADGNDHGG